MHDVMLEIGNYSLVVYISLLCLVWRCGRILHTAFNRDLRRVPGPLLSRFTGIPLKLAVLSGKRSAYIHALHEAYGPFVRVAPNEVAVADIEAWRRIHRIGSEFNKGPWYQGQSPVQYNDETCGVFNIRNNKTASQRRRLFQTAGTKKVVAEWEPRVVALVDLTVTKIKQEIQSHGKSDIMKWWTFMTSDVLGDLAFGESFDNVANAQKSQLVRDVEEIMPFIGMRITLPWLGNLLEIIPAPLLGRFAPPWDRFQAYGERAVQNTRAAIKGGNKTLFSKMVNEDSSDQMIPDEIVEREAGNIIIAGTDTTAMTLTYLTYAVLKDEAVKCKLVEVLRTYPEHLDWNELEKITYLENVIQEALRLYPGVPASLTRVVPKGGEDLGRCILPAGTIVGTQAWTFHRDATVYEDPLRFDPDRWNSPTPAMKEHFMAFGCPVRMCLGQNIARLEMLHAVFRLFRDFPGIKLAPTTTEESMEIFDFFTVKPKAEKCEVIAS